MNNREKVTKEKVTKKNGQKCKKKGWKKLSKTCWLQERKGKKKGDEETAQDKISKQNDNTRKQKQEVKWKMNEWSELCICINLLKPAGYVMHQ